VALSPVSIIAVILILVTPRARVNGPAFVVGSLVGLAIVEDDRPALKQRRVSPHEGEETQSSTLRARRPRRS
jgi:hypothetical protein